RTAWLELGTTRGEALGGAETEREQIARLALALWERREAIVRDTRLETDDRELREELLPELRAWLARARGWEPAGSTGSATRASRGPSRGAREMMTKTRMLAIEVTLKHAEDALAVGRILNLDDPAELRERI